MVATHGSHSLQMTGVHEVTKNVFKKTYQNLMLEFCLVATLFCSYLVLVATRSHTVATL